MAMHLRKIRSAHQCVRLAREIASVVPPELISRVEEFPDRIQFRIASNDEGWRVRRIVFSRKSLERLCGDGRREVKVEYLQRELEASARTRRVWCYPRTMASR